MPVAFMSPKEGAMTWVCGLVRNTANDAAGEAMVEKAYEVLDSYLSAGPVLGRSSTTATVTPTCSPTPW